MYVHLVLLSVEALTIRAVVVQILVVTLRVRVVGIQILVPVWAMFRAVETVQIRVVAKVQLILVVCIQTRAVGIRIRAVEIQIRVVLIQIRAVGIQIRAVQIQLLVPVTQLVRVAQILMDVSVRQTDRVVETILLHVAIQEILAVIVLIRVVILMVRVVEVQIRVVILKVIVVLILRVLPVVRTVRRFVQIPLVSVIHVRQNVVVDHVILRVQVMILVCAILEVLIAVLQILAIRCVQILANVEPQIRVYVKVMDV